MPLISVSASPYFIAHGNNAMTWQELADFINDQMPECNRNERATIMDNGYSCKVSFIYGIMPYSLDEEPNEDNYYSIQADMDTGWDY